MRRAFCRDDILKSLNISINHDLSINHGTLKMNAQEKAIVQVHKLEMKHGDILAMGVDGDTSVSMLRELHEQFKRAVPAGVSIVVVPNTTKFHIVTPEVSAG